LGLKGKTAGRECFCVRLHALSPSVLLPNVMVVMLDPHTFPIDVPLMVAGHVLNPKEPWNRVTCGFSGVTVQFHKGGFACLVQLAVDRKLYQCEIGRGQFLTVFRGAENIAS
jgi:hypothetical protein